MLNFTVSRRSGRVPGVVVCLLERVCGCVGAYTQYKWRGEKALGRLSWKESRKVAECGSRSVVIRNSPGRGNQILLWCCLFGRLALHTPYPHTYMRGSDCSCVSYRAPHHVVFVQSVAVLLRC